jgi:hypothetical protein
MYRVISLWSWRATPGEKDGNGRVMGLFTFRAKGKAINKCVDDNAVIRRHSAVSQTRWLGSFSKTHSITNGL